MCLAERGCLATALCTPQIKFRPKSILRFLVEHVPADTVLSEHIPIFESYSPSI